MPHSGSCYKVKFVADNTGKKFLSITKSQGRGYNSCSPHEAVQAMDDGDAVIVDGSDMAQLHELCKAKGIWIAQ